MTVVLIGTETSTREYINYEIEQSYDRNNGMLGIYIHNLKDQFGLTTARGRNPFDNFNLHGKPLSQFYDVYDWATDKGYQNIGNWIGKAARDAGR